MALAPWAACAQTYDFARLDELLERAGRAIPSGLEVMVVHQGRQIYWKQFGAWPKDHQANIASASKWLSGAVIMSLADDGLLSLDDRASKYLPYLTGDKASITVRQLMSHTAGFPGEFPLAHPCLGNPRDTLDRCAQSLARVPLQAPPGTAFIYSGAGMQIAGRVAEVVSGKDWQTLFRERIATPLGLTATDYEYRGPTRNPRISGGGRSTASDYMKFLTMLRGKGMYEGRRVLSGRAVEVMLSDQTAGAAIVESPFERAGSVDPLAPSNRYGVGNWLEDVDATGRSTQNSSPGMMGFTPLIESTRDLQVVLSVQSFRRIQPYYFELKEILYSIIPPASSGMAHFRRRP
jgi:CubicO group peptidase (beta-lactamase class C family)